MPKIRQGTSQINFKNSASIGRVFTPVVSGPVNLVLNPSFTTNATDWYIGNGSSGRDTSVFKSAPASFKAQGVGEFSQASTGYSRNSSLTIGQVYSASVWIRGMGGEVLISFSCGTNNSTSTQVVPNTGNFINYKIENVLCSGNTNLLISFQDYGEDNYFYVDDVSVVQGPTALVL